MVPQVKGVGNNPREKSRDDHPDKSSVESKQAKARKISKQRNTEPEIVHLSQPTKTFSRLVFRKEGNEQDQAEVDLAD